MKRLGRVIASFLCASIVMSSGMFATSPNVSADTGVAINSTNFPDATFRQYVKDNKDGDGDGSLSQSEIKAETYISVSNMGIKNLKGIEYFTELEELWCDNNQLTSLDLSGNKKLVKLACYSNNISELDVKNNIYLSVACATPDNLCDYNSQLAGLEKKTQFYRYNSYTRDDRSIYWDDEYIGCYSFILCNEDVTVKYQDLSEYASPINGSTFPDSNFRAYVKEKFDQNNDNYLSLKECCDAMEISVVNKNIENLTGIEYFFLIDKVLCMSNKLTKLDISGNPYVEELNCYDNKITSLDVSKNTALKKLFCDYNEIASLDLSKNKELQRLDCSGNKITSIDTRQNSKLLYVQCGNNPLASFSFDKNITYLDISEVEMKTLNVNEYSNLLTLCCNHCNLNELVISSCVRLTNLCCTGNRLTNLDISKQTELVRLFCEYNMLSVLDISNNTKLYHLICSNNPFDTIDISNNPGLKTVYSQGNNDYGYWFYDAETVEMVEYETEDEISIWDVEGEFNIPYDIEVITTSSGSNTNGNPTGTPTGEVTRTPTGGSTGTPTSAPTSIVGPIPTVAPTSAPAKSVGDFVNRCYKVALGRGADEAGYKYWLDALNNGDICGAQVGFGFIFSEEYTSKKTTDEQYVKDLYDMYFDREPDDAGFSYWVGLLSSGVSREEIFAGFANSQEFDNLCNEYGVVTGVYIVGVPNDQQGGVNSFVARLYGICLGRRPDMAGQAGWAQKLISGEVTGTTCAFGFVFSPEFIGKKPTNEEYVAYMYRAFFGREADEAGFIAWVQTLNDGGTYEDVFAGFSGSEEFANLCAGYGINA